MSFWHSFLESHLVTKYHSKTRDRFNEITAWGMSTFLLVFVAWGAKLSSKMPWLHHVARCCMRRVLESVMVSEQETQRSVNLRWEAYMCVCTLYWRKGPGVQDSCRNNPARMMLSMMNLHATRSEVSLEVHQMWIVSNIVSGRQQQAFGAGSETRNYYLQWRQCSRLKPWVIWVPFWRALKFWPFCWRVGSNLRRQSKNYIEMIIKLILNLCMNYMVLVSNAMWIIKNQASSSTSCSDNALHLLGLVAGGLCWGLQVTSSFSIWGWVLKGCFEIGILWRAKSRLKGIEDFNL